VKGWFPVLSLLSGWERETGFRFSLKSKHTWSEGIMMAIAGVA
jgi:hypothetical protein